MIAYTSATSSVSYGTDQTVLAVAAACVITDDEGRESARSSQYFAHEVVARSAFAPATARAGEVMAVWVALESAPPTGGLTIVTRSECAVTNLGKRDGDPAHLALEMYVRACLESRGAYLVYAPMGTSADRLVDVLAREALARGDSSRRAPEAPVTVSEVST